MIVCAGEALIDMLPRKTEAGEEAFAPYAGGAVFNTAIALGRLGAPTGFVSGLSTDLFGALLTDALEDADVDTTHAIRSDKPTTLAFVRLTGGQASYTFYDENTAGRMLRPDAMPTLPESVEAAFFGGISLVGEPCGGAYEALMAALAPTRAIMIDPNIRSSFITDEAAYRARIKRMMAMADIIKLSDEDMAWLLGDGAPTDHARALIEGGASVVCITEGSEGAVGYCAHGAIRVGAEKVDVVDTVGAGDTFNAGLLAALYSSGYLTKELIGDIDHATVASALRYGARAAAITVSRAGANPPWLDEM
ncbi:MAG: carbohydrate kinase [Paracoccaceae bacterium]|nr:carbohydrate kinase [Paracoccaceae bacterium]